MWQGTTLVAGLLLSSWDASGQLFQGLPDIKPDKIAGELSNFSPKKVAAVLQDGASVSNKLVESVKTITPEKAVKVIAEAGAHGVSGADGAIQDNSRKKVVEVVQGSAQHKAEASSAMKALGTTLRDVAHALNQTQAEAVEDALRDTGKKTQKLAEALHEALPKEITEGVRNADPQRVNDILQSAAKIVERSSAEKAPNDNENNIETVLKAIETADWWTTNWYWILLTLTLVVVTTAAVSYMCRLACSKGARSPNLLMESEIDMYIRPGGMDGDRVRIPSSEDELFTQF